MASVVDDLNQYLTSTLAGLQKQGSYLSRWKYELTLDDIAVKIATLLNDSMDAPGDTEAHFGTALLYKGTSERFYVGGSSVDRRAMKRSARIYSLGDPAMPADMPNPRNSFTGFGILHNTSFVLNNFQAACKTFKPYIVHENKEVESSSGSTNSYVLLVFSSNNQFKSIVRHDRNEDIQALAQSQKRVRLPPFVHGALRVSSPTRQTAAATYRLLKKTKLNVLSDIIKLGSSIDEKNSSFSQISIGDFYSDLIDLKTEFESLERLAFHFQTLFHSAECSVFVANKRPDPSSGTRHIDLNLAATTAWSNQKEHDEFRKTFFENMNSYSCQIDSRGPQETTNGNKTRDKAKFSKTLHAYLFPSDPVTGNSPVTNVSSYFPKATEILSCPSFLAVAIHAPPLRRDQEAVAGADSIEMEPYGVIRIVRDERAAFSGADRNLADLLAQGLSRWVAAFPVNYDLNIIWFPDDGSKQQEEKKRSLLTKLFGISPFDKPRFEQLQPRIENEFAHLLKKIFVNCNEITISRVFSGGSGASVLLVQNDYGQDLILKCCRVKRGPTRPHGSDHRSSLQKHGTPAIFQSGNDPISDEIENYRKFVEGRLPLTHNVIYPDLIRETWLLKGFATNLVGTPTGARKSLTEYCGTVANTLVDLAEAEDHISHVVGTFLARIWAWWYQHEKSKHDFEARLDDFLTNHLVKSDGGMFWFVKGGKAGMEEFDNKYHREISKILDSRVEECSSPGTIWQTVINQAGSRQVQSGLAVVHGDAHGDNIFFDTQSRDVWVIDFARTGRRVNIFDFAFLEADLKFHQLPNLIGKSQKVDSPEFLMAFNEFEQALASQTTYEKLCIPPQHKACGQLRVLGKIILDIRRLAAQQLERRGTFLDYQALSFLMAYKHIEWAETREQKALAYLSLRSIAGSLCAPTADNEISGGGTDGGAALPLRRRTAAAARKRKKTHG